MIVSAKESANIHYFVLERLEDESGVSGVGFVAEGVEFTDGSVTLRWRGERASTAVFSCLKDVEAIHGHNGKTVISWICHEHL